MANKNARKEGKGEQKFAAAASVHYERLAFTGRIAATIAHEIRNPLTNVLIAAQQLHEFSKAGTPLAKYIDMIRRNAEKANNLIIELLNCARPPKLNLKPYNAHEILDSVLSSTDIRLQKIEVIKEYTSKSPILNIDKEQIERAFSNLVINAIEAMSKSGGKLTIATENDQDFFTVKIQDTGKGIPEEDIIQIFDPFFSSKPSGTGLGLATCYGIIASHSGTIEVESKPKKGSSFAVFLPINQPEDEKMKF